MRLPYLSMIIERSMNDDFLSNTYLVADELGSHAVMIDAGGPSSRCWPCSSGCASS